MGEEIKKNIYEKLQTMRVELQKMDLKKSGQNKFVGYSYFEQSDFLPAIKELMLKHKTTSIITFSKEIANLRLINTENPQEFIDFPAPMAETVLKGAHPIQNLGAVETYQRRYLYINVFDIVEDDMLDNTPPIQPNLASQNINKIEKVQELKQKVKEMENKEKCVKCGKGVKSITAKAFIANKMPIMCKECYDESKKEKDSFEKVADKVEEEFNN